MTTDCSCSIQKKSSTVCQHTSDVCSYGDAYENARTEKKDMPLKKNSNQTNFEESVHAGPCQRGLL